MVNFVKKYWSSFMIGVFGCTGFYCLLHYITIATFHERSKHPYGYPASVIGGMISLCLCFVIGTIWLTRLLSEEKKGRFFLASLLFVMAAFIIAFLGIGVFGGFFRL